MFHNSKKVFTCLPDTDFIDEETYSKLLIKDKYLKTRVSVEAYAVIEVYEYEEEREYNKDRCKYNYKLPYTDDAYMEFNVPDPNKEIIKVEFLVGTAGTTGTVLETFYWNEKTLSWRARFNKNCPYFTVCTPYINANIQILSTKKVTEYKINMTKINFHIDLRRSICANMLPFDTFINGKIIRYEDGIVKLL